MPRNHLPKIQKQNVESDHFFVLRRSVPGGLFFPVFGHPGNRTPGTDFWDGRKASKPSKQSEQAKRATQAKQACNQSNASKQSKRAEQASKASMQSKQSEASNASKTSKQSKQSKQAKQASRASRAKQAKQAKQATQAKQAKQTKRAKQARQASKHSKQSKPRIEKHRRNPYHISSFPVSGHLEIWPLSRPPRGHQSTQEVKSVSIDPARAPEEPLGPSYGRF